MSLPESIRSHRLKLLNVPNRRRPCLFLAALVEPHEQRPLCCGPSPKGTICPPQTGPNHSGPLCYGATERDMQGWCGPASLQNKPPPISISTHHPPPRHFPAACCFVSYSHTNGSLFRKVHSLWERRRKTVRGELSVCKRKVFSSKALRRSVLLLSGQAESTLSHYHRRERGSRCLTRLRQSQHTDANTFTRISWAAALMQPDSRATSARVAAIDRLSLLVLSAAAFYFLFKVSSSPSARCCWQNFGVREIIWTSGQQLQSLLLTQNHVQSISGCERKTGASTDIQMNHSVTSQELSETQKGRTPLFMKLMLHINAAQTKVHVN